MARKGYQPRRESAYPPQARYGYQAYRHAQELGRLNRKRPAGYVGASRFPVLAEGQVYATVTGEVYHPHPCPMVLATHEREPKNLAVILAASVGGRRPCRTCQELGGAP